MPELKLLFQDFKQSLTLVSQSVVVLLILTATILINYSLFIVLPKIDVSRDTFATISTIWDVVQFLFNVGWTGASVALLKYYHDHQHVALKTLGSTWWFYFKKLLIITTVWSGIIMLIRSGPAFYCLWHHSFDINGQLLTCPPLYARYLLYFLNLTFRLIFIGTIVSLVVDKKNAHQSLKASTSFLITHWQVTIFWFAITIIWSLLPLNTYLNSISSTILKQLAWLFTTTITKLFSLTKDAFLLLAYIRLHHRSSTNTPSTTPFC